MSEREGVRGLVDWLRKSAAACGTTEYGDGCRDAMTETADKLEAVLNAETPPAAAEQRARELLAAEYERDGEVFVSNCIRTDADVTRFEQRAIRAIAAALAQQPEARGTPVASECNCPNGRAEHMTSCASIAKPEARGVVDGVIDAVRKEIGRATAKFPTWPTDPLHACGVVQEESGELAKAVLQAVYEPHKSTPEDVATEALQTAAMAIRFLASMDRYDWKPGEQHQQGAALTEARNGRQAD